MSDTTWVGAHRADPVFSRARAREEHDRLARQARGTDAGRQLMRCFPRWLAALDHLRWPALVRLAHSEPIDPNDADAWSSRDEHAHAILRRHDVSGVAPTRLTLEAIARLIDGQTAADRAAGLDWTRVAVPGRDLDPLLARAHERLPIDLDDPGVWCRRADQRAALARRLGLPDRQTDDLSRWALEQPDAFDADDLRCWRIASATWLQIADDRLPTVERVERPVGLLVVPALAGNGWQLMPVLSLDAIRLVVDLGGTVGRELTTATLPADAAGELIELVNAHTLHAGPRECLDSAAQLAEELTRALGQPLQPGVPRDARDRWGRLLVRRGTYTGRDGDRISELSLRVVTLSGREFPQRRVGSAPLSADRPGQASAAMDLGEAVQAAVERGLPLLLSSEAAGRLKDTVRVGRMKGRPGMLTITTADAVAATTRRVVAEQAIAELRALRGSGARVTLDAGARQVLRMVRVRPLADDPILLGRQQHMAALKVVGSGVDASQVGTGKLVTTARALAQRAAVTPRLRALVIAEGRLLGQWRDELVRGAPGRGLPPLAPNVDVLVIADRGSVAGQIRSFDRVLGERPGVVLASNSVLDRHPGDLQTIPWHLLVADEALRYVNPATDAHRALAQLRFAAAADCWLLTATPRGKSAEHLDVLVGLAVGDEAMIRERLNTREAGSLLDEVNAHRLRVNYGPHLVRVTRRDMTAWMPDVRPAEPLAIDADAALSELLEAIRSGGRDAYRRLLGVLREFKRLEHGSALYRAALVELSRAQAVVLSNVNVFVDASVDPETLTHSRAALAQALTEQGLVGEAMRGGGDGVPLLRGITAQTIAGISGDEQVLVFAERINCLRQLARTLRERHGVEAHVVDGSVDEVAFERLKHAFQAGEFPVFCLGPVAREGHNLQNASVIVHLDLPWVQTGLEQRVGRAARPGSRTGYVQTYIPYIRGGGLEHVVSVLTPRGAEHHLILDSFEGVKASESTIATQLGAIAAQVADSKDDAGYAATAARLRVAATVFGR
jgi:hypothetical protein